MPEEDWLDDDLLIDPYKNADGSCAMIHENINTLYHVPPMPIEDLPRTCACGRALTYAEDVVFVNVLQPEIPPEFVAVNFNVETKVLVHAREYEDIELNTAMVVCPEEVTAR
jgi:hypothetical protein